MSSSPPGPRAGLSLVVSSSDTGDLLALCTRVLVMCNGRVVREIAGDEITEQALRARHGGDGAGMTANTPTDRQLQREAAPRTEDEPTGSWAAAATTGGRTWRPA